MIFLESLYEPWVFFSLSAPKFVWLAVGIIFGLTIWQGLRLYLAVSRERKLYEILKQNLTRLIADSKQEPKGGLSEDGYEALRTELEINRNCGRFAAIILTS